MDAADVLAANAKQRSAAFLIGYSDDGVNAEKHVVEAFVVSGARDIQSHRASVGQQEPSCAAIGDVLTVHFFSALPKDILLQRVVDSLSNLLAV